MKQNIQRLLMMTLAVVAVLLITINAGFRIRGSMRATEIASERLFRQIDSVMAQNSEEFERSKKDISEQCITSASAAAYFLAETDRTSLTPEYLERIARCIDVDEIHLFTPYGTIYASSVEKYIGLSFYSGEQIGYFIPMLSDTSLSMCQDVTPNTAEQKPMQYAAVWSEDKSSIVQIGYNPSRIMEITERNSLPHVFSLLTDSSDSALLAVSADTFETVGAVNDEYVGKSLSELGIAPEKLAKRSFLSYFCGITSYVCAAGLGDVYIIRAVPLESMTEGLLSESAQLLLYIGIIFALIFVMLSRYFDKKIVRSIAKINSSLALITDGEYDLRVDIPSPPEFKQLSDYINRMVEKLRRDIEHDELTNVYSRRAFYPRLTELFKTREPESRAAVFMVDSDNLKQVNDRCGHDAGDEYLKAIARTLEKLSAPNKSVFRIGGDEFCVIVSGENSAKAMDAYLYEYKNIRDNEYITVCGNIRIPISFSVGMAVCPDEETGCDSLIKLADDRMYEDKRKRKLINQLENKYMKGPEYNGKYYPFKV